MSAFFRLGPIAFCPQGRYNIRAMRHLQPVPRPGKGSRRPRHRRHCPPASRRLPRRRHRDPSPRSSAGRLPSPRRSTTAIPVEDLTARRASTRWRSPRSWPGIIPVLVDPTAEPSPSLRPDVLVDAIVAKRNLGTRITDAPLVIALGPGFTAGVDCHAIVETNRGHYLGRVIHSGPPNPTPASRARSPDTAGTVCCGRRPPASFHPVRSIGDTVAAGDVVARVGGDAGRHPPRRRPARPAARRTPGPRRE